MRVHVYVLYCGVYAGVNTLRTRMTLVECSNCCSDVSSYTIFIILTTIHPRVTQAQFGDFANGAQVRPLDGVE